MEDRSTYPNSQTAVHKIGCSSVPGPGNGQNGNQAVEGGDSSATSAAENKSNLAAREQYYATVRKPAPSPIHDVNALERIPGITATGTLIHVIPPCLVFSSRSSFFFSLRGGEMWWFSVIRINLLITDLLILSSLLTHHHLHYQMLSIFKINAIINNTVSIIVIL